jgi:hypothetical protein
MVVHGAARGVTLAMQFLCTFAVILQSAADRAFELSRPLAKKMKMQLR